MGFLPESYDVPDSSNKYYKFKPGKNVFRIMSSPIMGYEYWKSVDSGRKPIRVKMGVSIPMEELETNPKSGDVDLPKHFWAMVVYDYDSDLPKVLEITQKGVMKSLTALSKDDDWGSPVGSDGYDIMVTKSGEGLETEYTVNPKPHKKLEKEVVEKVKSANINLEALFTGDDPFKNSSVPTKTIDEEVDKISKEIEEKELF